MVLPLVQLRERRQVRRIRNPLDQLRNAIGDLGGIHRVVGVVEHRNARTHLRIEEVRIVCEYDGAGLVGERGDRVVADALGERFVDVFGSDSPSAKRLRDSQTRVLADESLVFRSATRRSPESTRRARLLHSLGPSPRQ